MKVKELKNLKRKEYLSIRSKVSRNTGKLIKLQVIDFLKRIEFNNKRKGYLGIYWPLAGEIDLRDLKVDFPNNIALPVCINKNEMLYHSWGESPLQEDHAGIPAPIHESPLKPELLELLLVPAIAIDKGGFRLGYGGGYFDLLRSSSDWRKVPALVITPQICVSKNDLPREEWDIPFDGWITEQGFIQNNLY